MRNCIAYCPGGKNQGRWIPCPRRAALNAALCQVHANALTGVLYGLGVLFRSAVSEAASEDEAAAQRPRNLGSRTIQ
jgi:hypothetical protein